MNIKRNIYDELLAWKNRSNGKTALLIEGARRIGKSYIAEEFARNEYKSYILIDFSVIDSVLIDKFDEALRDLDEFFSTLSMVFGTPLYDGESLIIFDEVQMYPKARQMIKHLVADGRYDYLETGSLLSIKTNVKDIVLPSEEESIQMYPISFDEFLRALGKEFLLEEIKKHFFDLKVMGEASHRAIMAIFRKYLLVGGMPQAVVEYIETKDFEKVDRVKHQILKLYRNDIAKLAGRNAAKVLSIFDEIPSQLSKHGKYFNLSAIKDGARFRSYEESFIWLDEAMITNPVYSVDDPNVGLRLSLDNNKMKIFMADTGLLISHTFNDNKFIDNTLYKNILLKKLGINEGMIMENVVAQMLRASGHKLFYYNKPRNDKSSAIEVDFLINDSGKIRPIEVKSSGYTSHKSLDRFSEKYKKRLTRPYIIYTKDLQVKDDIICLPIYMTFLL